MTIMQRYLLSNLRTEWEMTILWRILFVASIVLIVLSVGMYAIGKATLAGTIVLVGLYVVLMWMSVRNWKFQRSRDGRLLVPLE